jgi:predicted phage baseplate assembly protein
LQNKPVLPKSLNLTVTNNPQDPNPNDPDAQPVTWTQVDDFLASQKTDLHYVLNLTTGQIQFGDGTHGEIPVAGAQITAAQYRNGGGVAGNVDKAAISSIRGGVPGVDKVNNDRPAVGGADEQSVDDLKQYAPRQLRAHNRAVTADDFAVLAAQAGGVAKATALALSSPEHPNVQVAGAITVVIVPNSQDMPPTPSSDQIRSVCAYLNQFRLLTTELWVRGPQYHPVRVEAQVLSDPTQAPDQVSIDISKALDAFLDPIQGKLAFGSPLYPTKLYAVMIDAGALAVTGIQVYVDEVQIQDLGAAKTIDPGDLFYGSGHIITVAPAGGQ